MQDSSSDETIKAKHSFKQFATDHGIKILHYHCDNGRFADNAFKQACEDVRQQLTFLRRERPFSEWNRRACDLRLVGESAQAAFACSPPLAGSSPLSSLTIRFAQRDAPFQCPASA